MTKTRYDPQKHHRRSIRLRGYNYAQPGAYFVTLCTQNRECVLYDPVVSGIVADVWRALPGWFPTIALDAFVVMPNHVHFIVWLGVDGSGAIGSGASPDPTVITYGVGSPARVAPTWTIPTPETPRTTPTLGDVVGAFKSLVFTVYLEKNHDPTRRAKFWQRDYYEHIVRDERDLARIRRYIINNPQQWKKDRDNLDNVRHLPPPTRVEDYLQDVAVVENGKCAVDDGEAV